MTLTITTEQAVLFQGAEQATQQAQRQLNLVAAVICAGHGITGGTIERLEPGDPPRLVVTVPDMADPNASGGG